MSSVGQALGGVVGAVAGFIVGGPTGALYGAQLGIGIGGLLDPPKGPNLQGPRLSDLAQQVSTYGAPIPRVYGTVAMYGNFIWLQGDSLTEVATTAESGGKGGPTSTQTTYAYYASFAVALCQGPIAGVRRIWVGADLIYDAGSNDLGTIMASNEAADLFTLYMGSDTQQADPLIQADKGVNDTPAYRGIAYLVFDTYPLAKHGNSLLGAQVKVEVVTSSTVAESLTLLDTTSTGGAYYPYAAAISGRYLYFVGFNTNRLIAYDVVIPDSPRLLGSVATLSGPYDLAIDVRGLVYVVCRSASKFQVFRPSSSGPPVLLYSVNTGSTPSGIVVDGDYIYVSCYGPDTLQLYEYSPVVQPYLIAEIATDSNPEAVAVSGGLAYVVNYTSNTLQIFDLLASAGPVEIGTVATRANPLDVAIGDGYAYVSSNAFYLEVFDISNPTAPALLGDVNIGAATAIAYHNQRVFATQTSGNKIHVVDVSDPTAPVVATFAAVGAVTPRGIAYKDSIVYFGEYGTGNIQTHLYSGPAITPLTVTLAGIASAECLRSNLLEAGDIDVTALTDNVRGYRIANTGALRAALTPLQGVFPFDVVQSGYQIVFVPRGGASVDSIPEIDLGAGTGGPVPLFVHSREMDSQLPRSVHIKYLDSAREYDIGEQYAERLATDAINRVDIDVAVVLTAAEAAQATERLLYLYWLERSDIGPLVLPPDYRHLEPADVITVAYGADSYEVRLTGINYRADGCLECTGKLNSATIYTSTAVADTGEVTGPAPTLAGPTELALLDIPLLRDDDDTAGFPVAMGGYLAGWPGGVLYRSEDEGQSWVDVVASVSPGAVIGYATTSLAVHNGIQMDKASTLSVRLYSGSLASVTELQMFGGANWFAYGADERWEIVAAQTVALQGDGSYILSDFMRGQKGSAWASGLHAVNDRIVLLSAAALNFVSINTSSIGSERLYRGLTFGKVMDSEANTAFTYTGINLECLSPVYLNGNRHPSTNDWTLTWIRRTRVGGEWRDYVDAALGESSESYEIDIFSDGTYTTLKRTLTATSQTVAYTSAQQVTDFGSNQATLYVRVYQLSATVGRGYALETSITR